LYTTERPNENRTTERVYRACAKSFGKSGS
jgi:hypothetical protein